MKTAFNVEIYGNEAYENTSGLLIFNLPELTLYGGNVKAYNNKITTITLLILR